MDWQNIKTKNGCVGSRWLFSLAIMAGMLMGAGPLYGGKVVDRVMVIVNDEIISLYELNQRIRPYAERIQIMTASLTKKSELLQKVRQENLSLLIDEKLADQEIRRLNIRVGDAEVQREVERFKSVNHLTDEELRQALIAEGDSLEEFRREIKEQILRARLVNREIRSKIVITNQEVEAYYKTHPEEFGGAQKYALRNILMKAPDSAIEAEKSATAVQLNGILEKLAAGDSFAGMAREYSEAPNAVDGGSLGMIDQSTLAPQIQAALAPLKPGQHTPIIETDQGLQIFYLEDTQTVAAESFEKVKPRIEDKLYNQVVDRQYEKWLQDLRSRAHIKLIK